MRHPRNLEWRVANRMVNCFAIPSKERRRALEECWERGGSTPSTEIRVAESPRGHSHAPSQG